MQKTSIHIAPVKGGSEEHNKRQKFLDYVIHERTRLNEYWECDSQSHRLAEIKALVKEKTGRQMQCKATPIREGVVVIKENTTMRDLQRLAAAIKRTTGIDTFQIAIHRDEGANGKINYHAHMVMDFMNHETGRSIKIGRAGASKLQDLCSAFLRMERGESSNKEHLSALQYKTKAETQRLNVVLTATEAAQTALDQKNKDILSLAEKAAQNERNARFNEQIAQQRIAQLHHEEDDARENLLKINKEISVKGNKLDSIMFIGTFGTHAVNKIMQSMIDIAHDNGNRGNIIPAEDARFAHDFIGVFPNPVEQEKCINYLAQASWHKVGGSRLEEGRFTNVAREFKQLMKEGVDRYLRGEDLEQGRERHF